MLMVYRVRMATKLYASAKQAGGVQEEALGLFNADAFPPSLGNTQTVQQETENA